MNIYNQIKRGTDEIGHRRARVANNGPADPAIKQSWVYVNAVFSAFGRILYTCTLGLLLAVLRGLDSGLTAFCREIGRKP